MWKGEPSTKTYSKLLPPVQFLPLQAVPLGAVCHNGWFTWGKKKIVQEDAIAYSMCWKAASISQYPRGCLSTATGSSFQAKCWLLHSPHWLLRASRDQQHAPVVRTLTTRFGLTQALGAVFLSKVWLLWRLCGKLPAAGCLQGQVSVLRKKSLIHVVRQ